MNVLIVGTGFVAHALRSAFDGTKLTMTRSRLAKSDWWFGLPDFVDARRPDVVINAAGRTGSPNVDWCEAHPVETLRDNTIGALTLAGACHQAGIHLLHVSSACMFDGGLRDEASTPEPWTTYQRSKYAAELGMLCYPNVGIVRIRMPIDSYPHSRNLITKLAGYETVCDVENSVTVLEDFAPLVRRLAEDRYAGVIHACNQGSVKHSEILDLLQKERVPTKLRELVTHEELVRRGLAKGRRSHCIIQTRREEYRLPPIAERLPAIIREYATRL